MSCLLLPGLLLAGLGSPALATTSPHEPPVEQPVEEPVDPAWPTWDPPRPPDSYDPRAGVRLNDPLGSPRRRNAIRNHVNRTIDSTPGGARIERLSWNIRDGAFVRKLIAAHKRGVSVRVLTARGNWKRENPNELMDRLAGVVAKSDRRWSNDRRPAQARSRIAKCGASCRGTRGIAHSKFFLFSHVGRSVKRPTATDVVMHGSANATTVAADRQWNDIHTVKNRPEVHAFFSQMFAESEIDRPAPYTEARFDRLSVGFLPWSRGVTDPALDFLRKVECRGATGGSGVNGRTQVRIGMTAMLDVRGLEIAKRLKRMRNDGCNIKMVYAVMGNKVRKLLRSTSGRGPVPIRQVVQDWQNDGVYDRYLHTKYVAVSGVYAGNRAAEVSMNGSMNWTFKSLHSDESVGIVHHAGIRKKYAAAVDRLFANPPKARFAASRTLAPRMSHIPGPDGYHGIEP